MKLSSTGETRKGITKCLTQTTAVETLSPMSRHILTVHARAPCEPEISLLLSFERLCACIRCVSSGESLCTTRGSPSPNRDIATGVFQGKANMHVDEVCASSFQCREHARSEREREREWYACPRRRQEESESLKFGKHWAISSNFRTPI